jgi:hypothetical protein
MKNENAYINKSVFDTEYEFNFSELERKLEEELSDLELLEEDRKKIGNPDSLGSVIHETVLEHINNQISGLGAEEFINSNQGLEFDPRNSAHIQTTENFDKGKIATHNTKIDYQKRYNEWQDNFQKDEKGDIRTIDKYQTGNSEKVLKPGAREAFDNGRDKGSAAIHKDHTVPTAEIIRDKKANAHLDKEDQIKFANSDKNLHDLDASANMSKSDRKMTEWLESERYGEKPSERFNINEKDLRKKDKVAREEFEKVKAEGEQKSIETGKKSQKEEIGRMGRSAGKAIGTQLIMKLLKDLLAEIIRNLISWFKSTNKKIATFLDAMKVAITSFVNKLKNEIGKHIKDALSTGVKVIVGAIFKPIARIIQKFGAMLKEGFRSIKNAVNYLRNPENKKVPFAIKVAQVGKIVVAGLTAAGAILGGQLIENGLIAIPVIGQVLAFEIPLIGSLASLIGLFMSAMVAGILGAIVLNLIDKFIAKRLDNEVVKQQIDKGNEILKTQSELIDVSEKVLVNKKNDFKNSTIKRHEVSFDIIGESLSNIAANETNNEIDNGEDLKDVFKKLEEL